MPFDDIDSTWYSLYADEVETVNTIFHYLVRRLVDPQLWADGRAQRAIIATCTRLGECLLRCVDAQRLPPKTAAYSIHKPLHQGLAWFLSLLHIHEGLEVVRHVMDRAASDVYASGRLIPPASTFEMLAHWPLRSLCFAMQLRAGLWSRNGHKALTQGLVYMSYNRGGHVERDLYLVQLMCMFVPAPQALANILGTLLAQPQSLNWLQMLLGGQLAMDAFNKDFDDRDRSQAVWQLQDLFMLLLAILSNENHLGLGEHVSGGSCCWKRRPES